MKIWLQREAIKDTIENVFLETGNWRGDSIFEMRVIKILQNIIY